MSWQRSIQAAVRALRRDEVTLEKQLKEIRDRIADLEGLSKNGPRPAGKSGPRRLSPQGRAAISRAAKKRWAEYRRQNKPK